jgi:hypothetical protein
LCSPFFSPFKSAASHDKIHCARDLNGKIHHLLGLLVKKRLLSPKNKDHQGTRRKMSRITRRRGGGVAKTWRQRSEVVIASRVCDFAERYVSKVRESQKKAYLPISLVCASLSLVVVSSSLGSVYQLSTSPYPIHTPKGLLFQPHTPTPISTAVWRCKT